MERMLVLGGTREARVIASQLAGRPDCKATLSLAGVTAAPPDAEVEMRIGGFGGAEGMAIWLEENAITTLVDATHPYASNISAHAALAAEKAGIRRLCLWRPAWKAAPDDNWQEYADWPDLISAIPDGASVFLTAGQEGIRAFGDETRFDIVARALNNPKDVAGFTFVSSLPGKDWEEEAALFRQHHITHLVAKNSGGISSWAKLVAARHLSVPVLLLARPEQPPPPLYEDADSLMKAL
jgi:precorrin-6A/cobalt-precorrin-6A reductase